MMQDDCQYLESGIKLTVSFVEPSNPENREKYGSNNEKFTVESQPAPKQPIV